MARFVYAFEPDKLAFEKLQSNVSLNRDEQSNIYMYNFGISDKNEPIQFFIGKGATSMSSVIENEENNSASYYAEFYDIETAISRAQIAIKDINFIKVDIEGGEFDLIPSLVNFFIENTSLPTLFISTHIPFFVTQDMSEEVKKKIQEQKKRQLFDSLKAYPFLYNAGFKKITSYEQLSGDRFSEIIATTKQLD